MAKLSCTQCKKFNQDLQRMTTRLADLQAVNLEETKQWVMPSSEHRIIKRYKAYISCLEKSLNQHCGITGVSEHV